MKLEEKFVRNIQTHKGNIFTFRTDEVLCPNGMHATRDVVDHNGGVCIAPITDEGELIFIKQFRYAYEEVLLELPAGKLEKGENKDVEAAGRRELEEEVGALAGKMSDFGVFYPTCGYCNEKIYLFAATDLTFTEQKLDADEFVEVLRFSLDDAVKMVMDGTIVDGKSIALIMKINQKVKSGELKI